MHLLLARFRSPAEFQERYREQFEFGGLFLPTRRNLEPGAMVLLDVRMNELKDHMLLRGKIVHKQRGKRADKQRAGLTIEFLSSELRKRDHLLDLLNGKSLASQRKHRRLPTELQVDWRVPNTTERYNCLVDDIGTGGAFLRTDAVPPPAGTAVVVELVPPGGNAAQAIEGRVAWISQKPGHQGIGIEFRCRDIGGMRRLRELLRRIERDTVMAA